MNPHISVAHNILNKIRKIYGVQHVYKKIDIQKYTHLSISFYSKCERELNELNFVTLLNIEDVTVSSSSPDPRSFLRIMSNETSRNTAAIYHVKPKFPWPIIMFLMRTPAKVYEFQTIFSDDAVIETTIVPSTILNSYPTKIIKQSAPKKSIKQLLAVHERSVEDYLANHPGVNTVYIDSLEKFIEHDKKTFEMTKSHLEEIGWVTKAYLYKQVGKNKQLADRIYDEIQNILNKEKPVNSIEN